MDGWTAYVSLVTVAKATASSAAVESASAPLIVLKRMANVVCSRALYTILNKDLCTNLYWPR